MSAPDARERWKLRAEILALWKQHGGAFHGPHVEHATATEVNFYAFAEALHAAALAAERERCAGIASRAESTNMIRRDLDAEQHNEHWLPIHNYGMRVAGEIATAIRSGDPTK